MTLGEYKRVLKQEVKFILKCLIDNSRSWNIFQIVIPFGCKKQWAALILRHKANLVATDFKIELFDNKDPDKKFDEKNLVFVLRKVR